MNIMEVPGLRKSCSGKIGEAITNIKLRGAQKELRGHSQKAVV
jgi:hypothetical protein